MREMEKILERCTDCGACMKVCEFLANYCETPKELAVRFRKNPRENPDIPYSCDLCGLCRRVCPEDLYPGEMCLEARREIVCYGEGDLSEYFLYHYLLPRHRGVKNHQTFSTSGFFTLTKGDPEKTEVLFFPGCSLPAYSPRLVVETYTYLKEKLGGVGIVLNCCGKPTHDIGEGGDFEAIIEGTKAQFRKYGSPKIVVACINCYKMFTRFASEFELISVYEVMAEKGVPEGPGEKGKVVTLHDSCPARYNRGIQDAVRKIVGNCGVAIAELKFNRERTKCCGAGGAAPIGNPVLADRRTRARALEAKGDLVTYCAHCRERFSAYVPSVHVLDLVFGHRYDRARMEMPYDAWRRWYHRVALKMRLAVGL